MASNYFFDIASFKIENTPLLLLDPNVFVSISWNLITFWDSIFSTPSFFFPSNKNNKLEKL